MNQFRKYPKIRRLGDSSTDGILDGTVHIEEKLDGANLSIWLDKDGELVVASRNKIVTEGFNGAVEYVKNHKGIAELFKNFPELRLYGEWLVKHTIKTYNELAYKEFYLFDVSEFADKVVVEPTEAETVAHCEMVNVMRVERIAELEALGEHEEVTRRKNLPELTLESAKLDLTYTQSEKFLDGDNVRGLADEFGIKRPQYFGWFDNIDAETIQKEFVGKSNLGPQGEGVVLKNYDFVNQWGDRQYAKIVTEIFKEDNALEFGGNNKHSETYHEQYFVNKFCTVARVRKIMQKIQPIIDTKLGYTDIPRISSTAYHDMIEEEAWTMAQKKVVINFNTLQRLAVKKFIQIYKDILDGDLSVVHNEEE